MEFISVFAAIFVGIILGTITGLTPGIHINLVCSVMVAYSQEIMVRMGPVTLGIIITAMAITHTIFDIIPSTLMGIPNSENLLMLLPAHKLTLNGMARLAINYGVLGSAIGIITTIMVSPLIIKILPGVYEYIKPHILVILVIIILIVLISKENKIMKLVFFFATGIVGVMAFSIKTLDQPLLPLLSGIFGLSALILSIKNKIEIPGQNICSMKISKKELIKYSSVTLFSSFMTNFLPGLTSSYTALVTDRISKIRNQDHYIIISNAANSSATVISFIALYSIAKTRSGAVAAIQSIMEEIFLIDLVIFISVSLITLLVCVMLLNLFIAKALKTFQKINYTKLSLIIILIIIFTVFMISGLVGILILIVTTCIGILSEKFKVEKIALTGCLILPVILYLI